MKIVIFVLFRIIVADSASFINNIIVIEGIYKIIQIILILFNIIYNLRHFNIKKYNINFFKPNSKSLK